METEVIVRGEGEARVLPDRAVIHITVDGDANTREDAYAATAPNAKAVDDVLTGHEAAIDRSSTAALVVHPKTRWRRGEQVRTGWRASRTSVVEVVDFSHLGDMIAELSVAGGSVVGPQWLLDATNEVHGEIRRLAAEDARRRAEVYAATLGLRLTGIAWVAEPGLRRPGDGGPVFAGGPPGALFRTAAGGAEDEVIDVSPDEMTITTAVEVGFTFATT
jgi:hypothetical protein